MYIGAEVGADIVGYAVIIVGLRIRTFSLGAVAVALGLGLAAIPSGARSGRRPWHAHVLAPASTYVGGSQLAVSETGAAVVAWVQGPPSNACGQVSCGGRGHPWPGFKVMDAQGTAGGGFGRARELSPHGLGGVYSAQLSSGISYVAWNETGRRGWRIAAVSHGHVSKPTVLPADAKLQGLFTGHSRKVAAVWINPGYPRWSVHYAFLDRHARITRQGNIARIAAQSFTFPQISLNDQGDLAAMWTQGSRFRAGEHRAELAWCNARGRCVAPRRLAMPGATPYLTVAVTDRGTVVGLVGAHPRVWTVVAHVGRPGVRVSALAVGGAPIAVSQGRGGVAAMFSPRQSRLAWTFFDPSRSRFTKPRAVPDPRANAVPQLAANLAGEVVASWFHTTRRNGRPAELRAVIGSGTSPGRRKVVVSAGQGPAQSTSMWSAEQNVHVVGISGNGNAVITWTRATPQGPRGLFYGLDPRGPRPSAGPIRAQSAASSQTTPRYLTLAEAGVVKAGATSAWGDPKFNWYDELLNDTARSPQATIWGVVPLFETVDYDALADPSTANLDLVKHFIDKAETYLNGRVTPGPEGNQTTPAYTPYPGNGGDVQTFFDDNSVWGLAFMDAYRATHSRRSLADAEKAMDFVIGYGWDKADGGGLWWNTWHSACQGVRQGACSKTTRRHGEALGVATDLAARLYQATGESTYLDAAVKYITWANNNILKWDGGYAGQLSGEQTMPDDGEGTMIDAFTTLCQSQAGTVPKSVYDQLPPNKTHGVNPSFRLPDDPTSWCSWATALAHNTAYGANPGGGPLDSVFPLNDGPQYDAYYVRGLLALYAYNHDASLYRLATDTAQRIVSNAQGSNGLFLKDWNGATNVPGADPGQLRTDAASLSVLAALASVPAP